MYALYLKNESPFGNNAHEVAMFDNVPLNLDTDIGNGTANSDYSPEDLERIKKVKADRDRCK